jgi:hypothetical protein
MDLKFWTTMALAATFSLGVCALAWAQPAGDLLEKAIYEEETVGDLNAAIAIYEQIIADAKANRGYVARAYLRLGLCQLKTGEEEAGTATLEKLIKDFPEQKDIIAEARAALPTADAEIVLGPEPWADGETLQLLLRLPTGLRVGTFIWEAHSAVVDGKDIWRLGVRRYLAAAENAQGLSRIDAAADTFLPISSIRKSSVLGNFEAVFHPGRVDVSSKQAGKDAIQKVDLEGVVYENDQFVHLARRLPLEVGYKTTLQLFPLVNNLVIYPRLEVTAKEKVTVPAGTFECFRVEFAVNSPPFPPNQTYWFSTDANRYFVKLEAAGTIGELASITHRRPDEPVSYKNDEFGCSLTAPAGWYFYEHDRRGNKDAINVSILDPEAEIRQAIVELLKKPSPIDYAPLSELVEHQIKGIKTFLKDYQLREEGWIEGEISGIPTVRFAGDYKEGVRKMVEYRVYIVGPKVEKHLATFAFKDSAENFESNRALFDEIVGSFQAK